LAVSDEVIFDEVIFDEVIFNEVIFNEVITLMETFDVVMAYKFFDVLFGF
jgi:hypothetical protein